jgi:PAS domain S-box-containing protein
MSAPGGIFFRLSDKLTIVSAFVLLSISISVYLVLTRYYEEEIQQEFIKDAEIITSSLTFSLYDTAAASNRGAAEVLSGSLNSYADLAYFVLTDDSSQVMHAYNLDTALVYNYDINFGSFNNNSHTNIYKTNLTVSDSVGNKIHAHSGIYTHSMNEKINEFTLFSILLSFSIFLIGVLLIYIVNFLLTHPIRRIVKNADKILDGENTSPVAYNRNDELGALARSFNNVAADLEQANSQIENMNRQMKVFFKDKIGELNFEVNQRRLAEFSLKKSEEQFRALFEFAPIGMMLSSIPGTILNVNQAFSNTLGYFGDELLNRPISEITYPDDVEEDISIFNKLICDNISTVSCEKRFIRKNGEIIYTFVKIALIKDEEGKPANFISQVVDITERKKVEQELIASKEKAEESDRLKSAFLAQMSHEIRTPLNIILNATPLIADELSSTIDSDTGVLLNSVNSAGRRLQRTIDMILSMSSVQSGNYRADFEIILLNDVLKKLVDEFKPIASEKRLQLIFKTRVSDARIFADKYTVLQVFQNLIHNSIKYTLKGAIEVIVSKDPQNNIIVDVRDTGIGMSEDYLRNIFLPFSQEDVGHKREFEGNGLGLALVKKYIELNKAEIKVQSIKDRGSIFTVVFQSVESLQEAPESA